VIRLVRVAINGFGRIGRLVFRAGLHNPNIEFVAINNPGPIDILAHLLKYDSVHGRLDGDISFNDHELIVNGNHIKVFGEKDPEKLPWKDLKIDVVAECSGFFTKREGAEKHLKAGAKKVVISAPASGEDITIVRGVNEHLYDKKKHHIISNASCTTNCFAPVAKVLKDNFGIRVGFMVTVHAYTNDQRMNDAGHKDFRRARAGAINIIPTSSGAAKAVCKVIPELSGRLHSSAMRVPIADGSIIYFTCELEKNASVEQVNKLFKEVSLHHLNGIIEYTDEPLVSSDIIGNAHSCIFDSERTDVDGDMLKVVAWYDNEWSYSNRMIDVINLIS
jgi:glyceraldehyde 3-phosphate dehydrogenase